MPRHVSDACGHYPKGVPEGHRCDAKLVLIGDAPDRKYDASSGIPFVGPHGYRLDRYLKQAGLSRNDIYTAHVLPFFADTSVVSSEVLEKHQNELHSRLGLCLADPWLIVPVGNAALGSVARLRARYRGEELIGKWRGSILSGHLGAYTVKVIPTVHPAAACSEPVLDKTCLFDWTRIAREAKFREVIVPPRHLVVQPSRHTLRELYKILANDYRLPLSFDIETDPSKGQILCISFAISPSEGFSITYYDHRDIIAEFLGLPNPKVGQNFLYDAYWLAQDGIEVANLKWDAGAMFHALDPNAGPQTTSKNLEDPNAGRQRIKPYSLAYMTSIFTDEPYYKDEGRDEDGRFMQVNGDSSKMHRLQEYNAKDACVTLEVVEQLYDRLVDVDKLAFYKQHYQKLFGPFLRTMLHGVRLDVACAETVVTEYQQKMTVAKATVTRIAGMPLESVKVYKRCPKDWTLGNPEFLTANMATAVYGSPWVRVTGKSLSTQKVQQYLYDVLKLPPRKKRGKRTADEAALQDLRLKHPEKGGELIDAILEFRKYEKLSQYLAKGKCDSDNRVRCQYKNLVQTGRCSSTENPKGTGMNLQNIAPEIRALFIPDEVDA